MPTAATVVVAVAFAPVRLEAVAVVTSPVACVVAMGLGAIGACVRLLLGHTAAYASTRCTAHTRAHHGSGGPAHRVTYRRTGGTAYGAANHRTRLPGATGAYYGACSTTQCTADHSPLFATHALADSCTSRSTGSTPEQRGPVVCLGGMHQGQQAQGSERSAQILCRQGSGNHAIKRGRSPYRQTWWFMHPQR